MNQNDTLQPFIFEEAEIRGEIVHINQSYQQILTQQPYPDMLKQLLAEALVSCLLMASSIKFEGSLSLQFQGDKRIPLLLVQCDHQMNIRGFAKFEEGLSTEAYAAAFLGGQMALTINQYNQTQSYQSIVSIQSTSMAENMMHYFAQSEQLSTRIWLAVGEAQAAGMMLQLMPDNDSEQRELFWEYATQLGQTVTEEELLSLENETLLHRLYHETTLRLFEPKPLQFKCQCSKEKMMQIIRVIPQDEAKQLLEEEGRIKITCDFCHKHYEFDSIDVALLFRTN